jgi:CDP-diacylglycerol--serine O-phosphatidyltransferase
LKSLAFAPTLVTLGNLLCGFAAIHFALQAVRVGGGASSGAQWDNLFVGAGLVLLGGVFDFLDGLIARVTRSTTDFGGQLDSLADMITFGVAPATLMVVFIGRALAPDSVLPSPVSQDFGGRAAWISAAIYVLFAAVRLARFNVEHAKVDFDYRMFRGLPTPGAACVVVALILFQVQMGELGRAITVYSMPFVALALAFLMVSRIPYRRFHRAYFLGQKPFSQVMTFVVLLAFFWSLKAPMLLLIVLWYAASGPLFQAVRLVRGPRKSGTEEQAKSDEGERRKFA